MNWDHLAAEDVQKLQTVMRDLEAVLDAGANRKNFSVSMSVILQKIREVSCSAYRNLGQYRRSSATDGYLRSITGDSSVQPEVLAGFLNLLFPNQVAFAAFPGPVVGDSFELHTNFAVQPIR